MVIDPLLDQHLAHFGINMQMMKKVNLNEQERNILTGLMCALSKRLLAFVAFVAFTHLLICSCDRTCATL